MTTITYIVCNSNKTWDDYPFEIPQDWTQLQRFQVGSLKWIHNVEKKLLQKHPDAVLVKVLGVQTVGK